MGTPTLPGRILSLLAAQLGLSDREITDLLLGKTANQQPVNSACRRLAAQNLLLRTQRSDGRLGNYPTEGATQAPWPAAGESPRVGLEEDAVKQALKTWLEEQGWKVEIKWAHAHGVDVAAARGFERWNIEVKGCGSRPEMRVNYFLTILGEVLQRMSDPEARYSIALPYLPQFTKLSERLPRLAKERTGISALLVTEGGEVRTC